MGRKEIDGLKGIKAGMDLAYSYPRMKNLGYVTDSKAEVRTTSSTGGQKGVKAERFDLIPIGPLSELARHYAAGAKKYDDHQWRQGYEWSKSYNALIRHLTAFWAGEDYDVCPLTREGCASFPDDPTPIEAKDYEPTCYNHTGSHHLVGVAWNSFTLLEFKDQYPDHDDRYKSP